MLDRRAFLVGIASLFAMPLGADAQPAGKVWRLGFLSEGSADLGAEAPHLPFFSHLRKLGYIEGQNLSIVYRFAEGRAERLPEFAAELVRSNVDLIAAPGTRALLALKAATSSIPVVMLFPGDPVGAGLVSSLTHPGGNITGTSLMFPDLGGKRLQLLREIIPKVRHVAIVCNPSNASTAADMRETETAGRRLGLAVRPVGVESESRLDAALAVMLRERPDALLILQDTVVFSRRRAIADFALHNGLPTASPGRAYVQSGALFGYGPDLRVVAERAAAYVDKIFKGVKPADLPVEQPTKFELVINLKTAKALGLAIPPSLLLRADQVIQYAGHSPREGRAC